ncbi:hypothetical protein Patl1_17836 [Pistacia atlantica]|uniref:Uncharacterized protein n=1 Tax=Pistacia atlantica TaxID=434234 RepID=A0ACC1BZQ3_9ROSI|nr:hypothetical protein Patl1_17836 [Pistacia atlantica]
MLAFWLRCSIPVFHSQSEIHIVCYSWAPAVKNQAPVMDNVQLPTWHINISVR